MKTITKIRNSWPYRHIQLVIIIGLLLGISIPHFKIDVFWIKAEAVVYERPQEEVCDLDCEIEKRTLRIFEEQKDIYLEKSRLEALEEMRQVIFSKIDNSPYVDYAQIAEYGYSN